MKLRYLAVVAFSVIMACIIIVVSMSSVASAFPPVPLPGVYTHPSITETAFKELDKEFFSISKPTKPMETALKQVVDANKVADDDQYHSEVHFDGENFTDGQNRIIALLGSVIKNLQAENAVQAQKDLGSALHTVQDFYAHSNWIELGHTEPNPDLGRPDHTIGPVAGPDEPTCEGSKLITDKLTSGYYGGENRKMPIPTKCRHGGPKDTSQGDKKAGINKDTPLSHYSPHYKFHKAAGEAAIQATEQFMRDIKARVTNRQLELLFGVIIPTSCATYSYTPTIDGSPILNTLELSMKVSLCHDARIVWIPFSEKISCHNVLIKKGSIAGIIKFGRCEPNGQGYYARLPEINPVYDIIEESSRGEATYQANFTVNALGSVTEHYALLLCSPPDLSPKC